MNNSILKFSVENYGSIRTKQSMRFVDDNLEKIKIICVFGANSAGKSNFFTALYSMISLIKLSYQNNTEDVLNAFTPFLLNTSSVLQPTTFSLTYRYEDEIFLYSFSFFKGKIINESLKRKSKKINKWAEIFNRNSEGINDNSYKNGFGRVLLNKTSSYTLMMTKAREENNPYAVKLFDVLKTFALVTQEINKPNNEVLNLFVDEAKKEKALNILKKLDIPIRDIKTEKAVTINGMQQILFKTLHYVRNEKGDTVEPIWFDIARESRGTRDFLVILPYIIQTLDIGGTLYIDEFGSHLHPKFIDAIIQLFVDNKNDASLIVNTHSSTILQKDFITKNNIVMVDKNSKEETEITPINMLDFTVREKESFFKRFTDGIYGGSPFISNISDGK